VFSGFSVIAIKEEKYLYIDCTVAFVLKENLLLEHVTTSNFRKVTSIASILEVRDCCSVLLVAGNKKI
jgi:hypothetical protein